jgi:hypothetical protein
MTVGVRFCDLEPVVASHRTRRVLVAVEPPLLGDLVVRELDLVDVEVIRLDDVVRRSEDLSVDVVITNGVPPAGVRAAAVVQLPDRIRGDGVGSLLTADGVERVGLEDLPRVTRLVEELCDQALVQPE